jgi:diacylglycerol kinase (ATP)
VRPIDATGHNRRVPASAMTVILNPSAGSGRAGRFREWLADRLRGVPDAELVITGSAAETTGAAAEATRQGCRRVLAVGGDGTVQAVVNGLLTGTAAGEPPSLGIVPGGSGNDLARSLGLPQGLSRSWSVATGDVTEPLDVPVAMNSGERRHFVSAGGLGFDAQVAWAMASRRRWQRGRAGYLLTTLDELRRFSNRRVTITLDDGASTERAVLLVAIANGAFYGGGMRICPDAVTDDGELDLCIVGDISRLTALQQLPRLYPGRHVDHPAVELRRARRVTIEGDPGTRVHLDGEPFGTLPLTVEIRPAALRVALAR